LHQESDCDFILLQVRPPGWKISLKNQGFVGFKPKNCKF